MPDAFAGGVVVTNLPVDFTTWCPNIALLLSGAAGFVYVLRWDTRRRYRTTQEPRCWSCGTTDS